MIGYKELGDLLSTIEISEGVHIAVAYNKFTTPNQVPPFIIYVIDSTSTLKADDKVHSQENNYIVDLCVDVKNVELENKIEKLFNDNYLPYDKDEDYLDSERMYQIRYYI